MKTKFLSVMAFVMLIFTSCSSDDGNTTGGGTTTNGFSWKENGGALKTATVATFSTQYKTFMVKDAANALVFEINLDGTSAATYSIGNSNAFAYTAVNPYYVATGGNVVITSNSAGKVSGTFTTTGTGGGVTAIEGTFTNVEVIP